MIFSKRLLWLTFIAIIVLFVVVSDLNLPMDTVIENRFECDIPLNAEYPTHSPSRNIQDKCYHCPDASEFSGFIGSPTSTLVELHNNLDRCTCDLLATDCLDSIDCLPDDAHSSVVEAIQIRTQVKQSAKFWDIPLQVFDGKPVGMTSQYISISLFRYWLQFNQFPLGHSNHQDMFVQANELCRKHNLLGRRCFLHDYHQVETYGDLELEAMDRLQGAPSLIDTDIRWIKELQSNPFETTPLNYLLAFGIVSRIGFSPRPNLLALYRERVVTIDHSNSTSSDSSKERPKLDVAMHLRRGDACRHEMDGYESEADSVDSLFQTSSNRKCYATEVYLEALQRIISKKPSHHIVVYLATDYSQSLTKELEKDHADIFHQVSWKYLDYSRKIFDYFGGRVEENAGQLFIESTGNYNKVILGETALLDIHHLSHGSVFIGHLGSRFGKMSWWQAIGRRAAFVPFFTVDGHGTCCDIDESCGAVAPHIVSMENCLSIYYPTSSRYFMNFSGDEYWQRGAMHRPFVAKAEIEWRRSIGI